jgi:hypothetical protein
MVAIIIVLILAIRRLQHREVIQALHEVVNEELSSGPTYEAREWLKTNPTSCALAGNRFDSTEEASKFVELLYMTGATKVLVSHILDEEWRIQEEGGPYADTLIVMLPSDAKQRQALFRIAAKEAEDEGSNRKSIMVKPS